MRLLTIQETSELLRLSRSKCYELTASGSLPSLKIGGSVRVMEADLLAYLESCRQAKPERKPRMAIPRLKHLKLS